MRADTPLPAVYGMKPLAQAVVTALEPTAQALFAHTHADLDISAMLFGPELASIGITWMPSQVSPSGLGKSGRPMGGHAPSGPPRDLPAVVPSSFQLEVPKHHVSP